MTRPRPSFLLALAVLSAPSLAAKAPPAPAAPTIDISVRIDPGAHRIEATVSMDLEDAALGAPVFGIHPGLTVRKVLVDGKAARFDVTPPAEKGGKARLAVQPAAPKPGSRRYVVRYDGAIFDPPSVAQFSRERIADQSEGTIQAEGVFLAPSSAWYPTHAVVPGTTMRVEVDLPPGWEAITEGSLKAREEGPKGTRTLFEGRWPKDGIDLAAGRWKRIQREHRGIKIAAYLFPEDADLAEPYLKAVGRYLDMYSKWFGPYAYDRFTVVENFFSTGYGMPGFTLLGRDVMRLPFIVGTSLGHEVAHNWWGNGVFVDESGGNWCEGLTTYVADYHYKDLESPEAAAEYRREAARDFTNYVSEPGRDFPLTQFTERSTPTTRAIGYGKSMMVFHMIERRIGKARFDAALRRVYAERLFRTASWDDWREAFSREAGEDLGWFLDQWVKRAGAPRLALEEVGVAEERAAARQEEKSDVPVEQLWRVTGRIVQAGDPWRVRVPLVIEAAGRAERRTVDAAEGSSPFEVVLPFRPETLRADPEQDVFRRLDPAEMPPVLSLLFGDPKTLFVVDDGAAKDLSSAYREVASTLTRTGEGEVKEASQVEPRDLSGRSVFLLGLPKGDAFEPLVAGLPKEVVVEEARFAVEGTEYRQDGGALLAVGRNRNDPARGVGLFLGLSPAAVRSAGRKLVHYGKYSFLAFVDGTNKAKGVAHADGGPLVWRIGVSALETPTRPAP
jgi:aminopeptidase N